ncbi:MAG: DUF3520 domain-containing protein, partial [Bacteroidia bacterium]|nr:DUF3520 domain-containing protein [Bacteroidia bacterium]
YISKFNYFPFEELDKSYRFSTAVAMFGSILRSSSFTKNIGWNDILFIARASSGNDDSLQTEFIDLVEQAKTLYTKGKKKRGRAGFGKKEK